MKRIAVALISLLPLVSVARADEASKKVKVQELVNLLHVDQISTQLISNLHRQLQGLSARQFGATPTADQQKQIGDLQTRIDGLVQQNVGWKTVEPDFLKLYSDSYTEPEVDSFLSFYKSPAGQTMLNKAPEIATKSLALTQQRMVTIEPQLRQMVADFVKQTTPAPPPPSLNSLPPSTSTPPRK